MEKGGRTEELKKSAHWERRKRAERQGTRRWGRGKKPTPNPTSNPNSSPTHRGSQQNIARYFNKSELPDAAMATTSSADASNFSRRLLEDHPNSALEKEVAKDINRRWKRDTRRNCVSHLSLHNIGAYFNNRVQVFN